MTRKTQAHPEIAPGETVIQACYGPSHAFVRGANRSTHSGGEHLANAAFDAPPEGEGLDAPLAKTGVLALTDRRVLFFPKLFAMGRPKVLGAQWPLSQIETIEWDRETRIMRLRFSDGEIGGLYVPPNQKPMRLVEGFAEL